MGIPMSPHHYFAIFLLAIKALASTVANTGGLQAYPVDFALTLDVEELTGTSYQKFINDLRIELAMGAEKSGEVPILPSYGNNPPHLFDVMLTAGTRQVTVRVRRDNLYVRGYLMQTPKQWMEFKSDVEKPPLHMVDPNSKFLAFGDKYGEMEGAINKPNTPEKDKIKVTNLEFTKEKLKGSVLDLSKSMDKKQQAKALIFMAQMISEAARFSDVSRFFERQFDKEEYDDEGKKVPVEHLPGSMRDLQNDWGKFSRVVQCYDKYKQKYKYTPQTINNVEYKTPHELRTIFGVMLKERNLNDKTCGIKKLADEDEGEAIVILSADI